MQQYSCFCSRDDRAWLTTPTLLPPGPDCTVRFFYHQHGRGAGNLSLYSQAAAGDALDLDLLWRRSGAAAGGEDLNLWGRAIVQLENKE